MSKLFVRFPSANQRGKRVGVCPLYVVAVEPTASGVAIRLARGGVADQVNIAGISEEEAMDRLEELAADLEHSFLGALLRPDLGALEDKVAGVVVGRIHQELDHAIAQAKGSVRTTVREELRQMATEDTEPTAAEPAGKPKKK